MSKVKMKLNLGELDRSKYGLPENAKEGKTIEVNERQEAILVEVLGCAERVGKPKPAEEMTSEPASTANDQVESSPESTPTSESTEQAADQAVSQQATAEPTPEEKPGRRSGRRGSR